MDVQVSKGVQVNWGTVNIPTILSVLGVLWYTATHTATQDARIDNIEVSRAAAITDYKAELSVIRTEVAKISNMEYRLTTAETSIDKNNEAVNARIDRFSSALQDIRDGIGKLNTNYELLSQKWDQSFPLKKSELETTPPPLIHK